jgi:hypothetical protein
MATKRHSIVRLASVSSTAGQVAVAAEQRRGLLFSPPLTGSVTVSPAEGVASGVAINLLPGSSPVQISYETHGDVVCGAWYGVASGNMSIGFLETYEESDRPGN